LDRPIVYPAQLPTDTVFLSGWKSAVYGVGHLAQAALGTPTAVSGLALTATGPASLTVNVGPGSIYIYGAIDATSYGSLIADPNNVVKQGILAATVQLAITPPATAGFSQIYLVQVSYTDTDGGSTVLPYYNSVNPSVPFSGPSNNGLPQYTMRFAQLNVSLKQGIAAATGSQVTPTPDSGFTGLYAITVANGQATITSANFATYVGAPFIPLTLPQIPLAIQQQLGNYAVDTGTANALAITLPAYTTLVAGLALRIKKGASANTGAVTLNINGGGATSATWSDGSALGLGDWPASAIGEGVYDGAVFRLNGPLGPGIFRRVSDTNVGPYYGVATGTADAILVATPAPGLVAYRDGQLYMVKIASNNATTTPTMSISGLGVLPITRADGTPCAANDLLAGADVLFSNIGGTALQIVGLATSSLPASRARGFFTSTTFTVPSGVYNIKSVKVWGAGGGGGGSTGINTSSAGGGGGGYTNAFQVPVTPGQVITVTIGAGGTGGVGAGNGTAGGDSDFGSTTAVHATGGGGGGGGNAGAQGVGGVGSVWQITLNGRYGNIPTFIGGVGVGGQGGAAPLATSIFPLQVATSTGLDGGNGIVPGGGANGACTGSSSSTHTGGVGGDGFIVIEY
jgi:hypothetical protein